MTIKLYGTKGCHLCDQAESILKNINLQYCYIDIADDQALMDAYAIRIPVLYCTISHKELGWPFDERSLINLGRN